MKVYKRIILVLLTLVAAFSVSAEDSGTAIMKRCAEKLSNAPSVSIEFVVAGNDGATNGTLLMSKKLFKLTTPDASIWFDGTTQWTYFASSNEVNVTEPTGEELMESNPFELISSSEKNFNSRALKSSPSNDIIELTPKYKGLPIISAKVTISKSTGWPTAMIITFDGGNTTSISIGKVTVGKTIPGSQFRYDKKLYPKAQLVDLR